jgi:hypothetical protein
MGAERESREPGHVWPTPFSFRCSTSVPSAQSSQSKRSVLGATNLGGTGGGQPSSVDYVLRNFCTLPP